MTGNVHDAARHRNLRTSNILLGRRGNDNTKSLPPIPRQWKIWRTRLCYSHSRPIALILSNKMKLKKLFYLTLVGSILARAAGLLAAEPFRVGFPSLATGFAPSWVA